MKAEIKQFLHKGMEDSDIYGKYFICRFTGKRDSENMPLSEYLLKDKTWQRTMSGIGTNETINYHDTKESAEQLLKEVQND